MNMDTHLMEYPGRGNTDEGEAGWARYVEIAAPQGAQGTVRIAALLRIVAAHNVAGMKLNEIAKLAGLEQSTAHRIVTALHSVGFLSREPGTRRYHLGPLLFELFTTAFPHFNIREICLPSMASLAERLGDTVYLRVRSGFDGVCVERYEGTYAIRTCTVDVGQRWPLGIGAGNLALLSAIRETEANTIMEHCAARYEAFGKSEALVRERVAKARDQGYIYQDTETSSDVRAVALPIVSRTGHPFGALSMTAITSRMTPERAETVLAEMRQEIAKIVEKISEMGYV